MKVFLAGVASHREICEKNPPLFMLESYYYFQDWEMNLVTNKENFLLDSGAFTFCGTGGFKPDKFEAYLEKYAEFVKHNHITQFFELDVDSIVGYDKVIEYRKVLERLTNKQPIPVWHINRGKEEFIRHCDEYPYVALGGYVAAIKANDPRQRAYVKAYPWFINEAHKRGTKIHGLGFTATGKFAHCHFDSVDSTTWTVGGRLGNLCTFDGKQMKQWASTTHGKKTTNAKALTQYNYEQWLKFQKYAVIHY